MRIKAKFASRCGSCGGRIRPGDEIEWAKGQAGRHVKCASSEEEGEKIPKGPISLSGGSGYGCEGWKIGELILSGEKRRREGGPDALVIVTASHRYVRDDGFSFGVGDDEGYLYFATARAATPEEIAPAIEGAHARALKDECELELKRVYAILEAGERLPETDADRLASANGESILLALGIHGGRRWVRIEADSLILIDGGYYDDYRRCAWRSPRTAELERRVRTLEVKS